MERHQEYQGWVPDVRESSDDDSDKEGVMVDMARMNKAEKKGRVGPVTGSNHFQPSNQKWRDIQRVIQRQMRHQK